MSGRPWQSALLRSGEQGLLDLAASGASDVVFVREGRAPAGPFFDALIASAQEAGFVTSSLAIGEDQGFEALDEVVRGFVKHLAFLGGAKAARSREARKGLVGLLDAYVDAHGKKTLERFDEAAGAAGFFGDLHRIARGYLSQAREPRQELKVLRAWLEGTELSRSPLEEPLAALSPRTAKRALADLSRLVVAMGHRGLVLVARRADHLTLLSPVRREMAYTVLRELIDNADSARGLTATRLYVSGDDALYDGSRGITLDGALATRVLTSDHESNGVFSPPVPHATLVPLVPGEADVGELEVRDVAEPTGRKAKALRALVRACQGLPPFDLLDEMTVGYESVDQTLDSLFQHAENDGSVFALVSGAYGSGKTHLLLHAEQRALAEKRPVFRLAVERLDTDLGNPQRHLSRLLEHARLPLPNTPGPLDRLSFWLRSEASSKKFAKVLREIGEGEGDSASAAKRAERALTSDNPRAILACLGATDLVAKSNNASYRQDAYARLLLWLELLERMEGFAGPLVLIDEAENLYRGGTSRAERRTALRSLGFYCGGTLPRACVVLAVTPDTLELLREESAELLDEVSEQRTLLSCEDATMLRRRLTRNRPIDVVKLSKDQLVELADRVRETHASARGSVRDEDWDAFVARATTGRPTPRELIRDVMTHLERAWWTRAAYSRSGDDRR